MAHSLLKEITHAGSQLREKEQGAFMIPMNNGIDVGSIQGIPVAAAGMAAAKGARPAAPRAGDPAPASKPPSFHRLLREAGQSRASGTDATQTQQSPERPSAPESPSELKSPDDPLGTASPEGVADGETPAQKADGSGEEDASALWALVLQMIQDAVAQATGQRPPETAAESSPDQLRGLDVIRKLAEFLEAAHQDPDHPGITPAAKNPLLARLGELLTKLDAAQAPIPEGTTHGDLHRLLRELRIYFSGGDSPAVTPADTPADGAAAAGPEPANATLPKPAEAGADVAPKAPGENSKALRPRYPKPDENAAAEGELRRSELRPASRRHSGQPEAMARPAEGGWERSSPVKPGTAPVEALKGLSTAAESARSTAAAAGQPGLPPVERADQAADGNGYRQPGDERLLAKPLQPTEAALATEDGGDASEVFRAELREQRPADSGQSKPAEAASVHRERDGAPATVRASVFDQIVQRAVVQLKNQLGEVKIDLKPEFLGNVRMQIVADSQQVSVRILTELPAVRDMIESGFQQLKHELQNQGLNVERLEVAVAEDHRQRSWQQARNGSSRKPSPLNGIAAAEAGSAGESPAPIQRRADAGRYAGIDTFV